MHLAEIDPINLYETHKTFSLELASVLESWERMWEWTVCRPYFWAHQQCPGLIRELGQTGLWLPYAISFHPSVELGMGRDLGSIYIKP